VVTRAVGSVSVGSQVGAASVAGGVAVRDLRVLYRENELLRGVSSTFRPNAVSAIVGPTGCGKTTLLRSINRMHDSTPGMRVTGSVTVGGEDVYGHGVVVRRLRRKVGMLFQRANPFPQSIADNVSLAPLAHGTVSRHGVSALVEEHLTLVGLWDAVKDRLDRSPFHLSGGQQQLLCLARTLALSPEVLLLDEPTSALDPDTTEHIEGLIRQLSERVTVLVVTHNLAQANRIADDVLFLMAGSVVEFAPAQTFFQNPADERSRAYVSGRIG
jgi:phosphate transport system ATP-binding protein